MFFVAWDWLLLVVAIVAVAYETNHRFRYCARYVIYVFFVMLYSLFLIPVALVNPGVHNTVYIAYFMGPTINFLLGIKWHLRNPENFVSAEGSIITANHQSCLDFLGMITHWPTMKRCAAIAKKELNYVGPFGLVAGLCGTVFIRRERSSDSRSALNKAAEIVKQKKLKLWIFPEGTRNSADEMLPFKKGAFHMAISSQLPITPVVYSRYHFLDHNHMRFDPGEVIMTVLPPVSTKGLTLEQMPELMERVRNMMAETYLATSEELSHAQNSLSK